MRRRKKAVATGTPELAHDFAHFSSSRATRACDVSSHSACQPACPPRSLPAMLSPKVRAIVHHASAPLTPTLHGATSRGGSGNFFPDSAAAAIAAAGSPGFQPSTPRSLEAGSPGGVLLNHTPLAPFSLDSPPHSAEPSPALGPHSAPASPSPLPADELVLRRPARPPELQGERSLQEFEIGTTIGTGSFGRVSLVRLASEPIKHKGFFALKVMKKAGG
jgi:hypothetical protein